MIKPTTSATKGVFLAAAALFFFFSLSCPVKAQNNSSDYRLGPGDVVKISILAGGEEQVSKEMVVGENGHLNVPFVGKVRADGRTVEDIEKDILRPLERDYFVSPQVHLQIAEYHSLKFFISGAVKNPGMFELDFTPTVMDLIAKAGGVLPERGNVAYILHGEKPNQITRSNADKILSKTEPQVVDLKALLDEGDMSGNITLNSGDTVYIPLGTKLNQAASKVYVQGRVKKPGMFDYQPGLTALSACIMAGGFDKYAAPNRAKVIRGTGQEQKTIKIDLNKVQNGEIPDIPLEPGDRIHIPESWL